MDQASRISNFPINSNMVAKLRAGGPKFKLYVYQEKKTHQLMSSDYTNQVKYAPLTHEWED